MFNTIANILVRARPAFCAISRCYNELHYTFVFNIVYCTLIEVSDCGCVQIQMKILLSKFITRFRFQVDPSQSFDINELMTLRVKGGCRMTLTLKNNNAAERS